MKETYVNGKPVHALDVLAEAERLEWLDGWRLAAYEEQEGALDAGEIASAFYFDSLAAELVQVTARRLSVFELGRRAGLRAAVGR